MKKYIVPILACIAGLTAYVIMMIVVFKVEVDSKFFATTVTFIVIQVIFVISLGKRKSRKK